MDTVGCHATETGLNLEKIQNNRTGFYSMVNGRLSFCVFEKIGENRIKSRRVKQFGMRTRVCRCVFECVFIVVADAYGIIGIFL